MNDFWIKNDASLGVLVFLLVTLAIFFVAAGPIATILMLTTLFPLEIPINFGTWFAALWFNLLIINFGKSVVNNA